MHFLLLLVEKMAYNWNKHLMLYDFVIFPGIRSQSRPHDIMHEVFRAMKTLGYVRS